MPAIDSHQHFWRYEPAEYPWIGPGMERLARDYLPADLEAVARPAGLRGSVAVQARQSLAETRWLLELARGNDFIRGVVGWVDLRDPGVGRQLAALAPERKLVGVRHVVQDEPDPRFLLGEQFVAGLRHLHAFGLTYDLLLFPAQLPAAVELAALLPEQPLVLDHLAKPRIGLGPQAPEFAAWRREIESLARHPQVCAKLSGLVTEADWGRWRAEDFAPFLEVALAAFGPHRLMFGSDWPVCLLSADYAAVTGIVTDFIAALSEGERASILGGTAEAFYGLE